MRVCKDLTHFIKMPAVLNLSNEVVKLRAEVKRVKVLLIRKLIRQMSILEKKKGTEVDLERHRRRAERLREEIHELKVIAPDKVTKAALQTEISFEKVCQNKEASLSERAIARIATHPQFSKIIQSLKEAIKAFKVERISARKAEKQANNNAEDITLQDQPQEGSGDDDEDSEKLDNNADEELKEEEGDKMIDKLQEVTCGSSQVSQETSLETSNEQTSQCLKTQMSTTQDSADPVSVPEEVVRMRKEVKRTRVLVISKLTQQVAAFKMKKGEESEVKKNQELAAQLMKDIQALRNLKPDQLTAIALQENIELEKVLLDPLKSPTDRAVARIVTHTRFINKLQKVREAIEKERAKAAEAEQKKTDRQAVVQSKNAGEEVEDDGDDDEEKKEEEEEDDDEEEEEEEEENKGEENDDEEEEEEEDDDKEEEEEDGEEKYDSEDNKNKVGNEKTDSPFIEIHKSVEPTEKTDPDAVNMPTIKAITTPSEKSRGPKVKSQIAEATALKTSPKKSLTVSSTESKLPKNIKITEKEIENIKPEKKQDLPETSRPQSQNDDEESDLSDDDHEEKEYFDDSTEERFHKQSSYSEESDNDDFFLGKVTKFKKRKSGQAKAERTKSETQTQNVEKSTSKPPETNLGKLQSVFCSTLSKSSISQKPKHGFGHDGSRSSRFQKGPEGRMKPSLYIDSGTDRRSVPFKPNKQTFKFAGQRQGGPPGAGRGRSQFEQHQNQNARGPSAKMSNPPQQSLHPSWEASKKRKEQQAQITGFQGKKIKFDDDD